VAEVIGVRDDEAREVDVDVVERGVGVRALGEVAGEVAVAPLLG
jgi:hypothetical protein